MPILVTGPPQGVRLGSIISDGNKDKFQRMFWRLSLGYMKQCISRPRLVSNLKTAALSFAIQCKFTRYEKRSATLHYQRLVASGYYSEFVGSVAAQLIFCITKNGLLSSGLAGHDRSGTNCYDLNFSWYLF